MVAPNMLRPPPVLRSPRKALERFRLCDWGLGVSVCIATMAENRNAFVVATDQMATIGDVSTDHAFVKVDILAQPAMLVPFWAILWAGNDISVVPPIVRYARSRLGGLTPRPPLTADEVATTLAEAYQIELRKRINAEILSPFGVDVASYPGRGEEIFGDHFPAIIQRIGDYVLDCDLLVCGFDNARDPVMFTVARKGMVQFWDKLGFGVIGSGSQMALSSFVMRGHNREGSLEQAIYNVCEAKFWAEKAPGVGKHTTVLVIDQQQFLKPVPVEVVARIRGEWERDGRPSLSNGMMAVITAWVNRPTKEPVGPIPQSTTDDSQGQPPSPG